MLRFHCKDLQHQKTLKQTKMLDNNTLTNINKGVRLSTKQHSSANVNCFILDEGGSCYENERDKIFFKDAAEHRPYRTTDVKVMLLFLLVS